MTSPPLSRAHRLFVYGTLLSGMPNHAQLQGAVFVAQASTVPRYSLANLGGYPGLLERGETAVVGELYDVDEPLLAALDRFEDVPSLYERKTLALARRFALTAGAVAGNAFSATLVSGEAQAYVLRPLHARGCPLIPSGDWRKHRASNPTA